MGEGLKKWYVLRTLSGKEKKVKQYIENELEEQPSLKDFVFQVVIPTEKVLQIRRGKKIIKEKNYYPGYILVEAVLNGEVEHFLRNVPNVVSFVGAEKGKKPSPLREEDIAHILKIVDNLKEKTEEEALAQTFNLGEEVKIIDGAFNGFVGVIDEINEERKKLKVMVKIFGRKTPLELKFTQVEKLN